MAIVLFSGSLGFWQGYEASNAVEDLPVLDSFIFSLALAIVLVLYLGLAEVAKTFFYRFVKY